MRFIHICQFEINMFTSRIVNMIADNKDLFPDNHRFVIYNKHITNTNISVNYEIEYCSETRFSNVLKKYDNQCDYFFVHYFPYLALDYLRINKRIYKKIVWVEWGGDLYYDGTSESHHSILRRLYTKYRTFFLKKTFAIGVPNWSDASKAFLLYGKNTLVLPLTYSYMKDYESVFAEAYKQKKDNSKVKVLVGNSANGDFHIPVIKMLQRFKDKIEINVVLSYGNENNKKKILNFLQNEYDGEFKILSDFMERFEYMCFLRSIDIGVFGTPKQNSLGNIEMLNAFGAKLFLHKEHSFLNEAIMNGFEIHTIDELDKISFEELSKPIDTIEKKRLFDFYLLNNYNERKTIYCWKNGIDIIKAKKRTQQSS